MQVTIGSSDGKTHQIEIEDTSSLQGKKMGETFSGGIIGLDGYELEITGGSDKDGFPMRKSIEGPARRRVLIEKGSGVKEDEDGVKRRKSVRGDTVSEEIQQLNTKVVKEGSEPVEELLQNEE